MASRDHLGKVGVWSPAWSVAFRSGNRRLAGAVIDGAAALEELGQLAGVLDLNPCEPCEVGVG